MIQLSGRRFALPRRPVVVFCVDGCSPDYLDAALAQGLMPRLRRGLDEGAFSATVRGQMPSFTNPNNVSIVTGLPPSGHGISGNFYFDAAAGREVPMNEPRFLRAPTILAALERAGVKTLCVTAKDKLRALLGSALGFEDQGPAPLSLSAEKAHEQRVEALGGKTVVELVGKPNPSIYDWEISPYAMEVGLALHAPLGARVLYVSLTDFVQHKDPPGGPLASRFYARFDELWGRYLDAGFLCALTADHGMNDKTKADGSPDVRYLDDLLAGAGLTGFRVILPITDPYVVHHGALGSFATVYLPPEDRERARRVLAAVPGIERVLARDEAARELELPEDRIGDLVVLGDRSTVLGKSEALHDLSAVRQGLRSHGGLHEARVPLIVSSPLREGAPPPRSNADIFDVVLNSID